MPSEGKTAVPRLILDLVDRFERNREAYKSGAYNETQVRREFLDPFFKALGWDIDNEQGYAEAYKDVVHEDAIKIGDGTRAPDYSFRIGGTRKFFLEAKRPSVDIKNDASPAFQLRRYAWTTKLPLSILTDFEEFAVYDCRVKPDQKDKASVARVLYIPFTEYATRWDEIASVFSRDAVLKGSFDKYAEENKAKRGTAAVDDAFLQTIESWRKALAENLALRNKKLTQRETNFAVQRIIDRIIFLRICEGRGIEDYGKLQALAGHDDMYPRLGQLFKEADDRYNSGLFHFKPEKGRHEPPDQLTLSLDLDDKLLRGILKSLYYPESPYVFSALPADVLGQVYEQFLGKVIRLTEGHHAKVEDKPEVKKAGGVYYTPTYIVDYIVQNTVGKLLEGKTLKQAAGLRILDPACGSGSFLLGAYEYLLKWHLDFYIKNEPTKWARGGKSALVQVSGGDWKLTIAERKRILLANIYGVDIDAQAVETTKLSLLLKVLEGETQQSLQPVLLTFQERALPDLGDNIKCGNSLIGPDFYQQQLLPLDEEARYRINVFDWKKEFAEIFAGGGFDAVIGNPPYISVELTIKDVTEYYLSKFRSASGRANSFSVFIEQAIELLKHKGLLGFIVSNRILTNTQLAPLRKLILEDSTIQNILTFKKAVFKAAVDTAVLICEKEEPSPTHSIEIWSDITDLENSHYLLNKVPQALFLKAPFQLFNVKQKEGSQALIQKILNKSIELSRICDVKDGIILGGIKELFLSSKRINGRYEKWLEGNEVSRYAINWEGRFILYDKSLIEEELKRKRQSAKARAITAADFGKLSRSGIWLRTPEVFRQEKILTRQNAKRLIGTLDNEQFFVKNSLHSIILEDTDYSLRYVLGLINSKLLNFYFQDQIGGTGEVFSQMKIAYIRKLPLRPINFSSKSDKSRHNQMVRLVDEMLGLQRRLVSAKTPQEKTSVERQISATDAQIDRVVYDLYGLTPEEITIVETAGSV
jgi:type I restriction-modification system DNA methylase subunit